MLFDGQVVLVEAPTASIAEPPTSLGPLDTLFRSIHSVTMLLDDYRRFSKPRQEVVLATPALHGRGLSKLEALSDGLASVLRARGVPDLPAASARVPAWPPPRTLRWPG